ncbi:hypothetical protein [Sphingobacterium bovistauri]|uniref:Uncharacterized protein n=1 Tax=Sphingobacterium bovistauri TaxID=2781959 RepID=A0ABS7Z384_9SPHI|nr:hypothetical protein [Sphingobacterium bovistauri]MCA5004443.1 hypothetical protein [Sphingobacterium bovistauri]
MNFFITFGRIIRFVLAVFTLVAAINYIQESTFNIELTDIAKQMQGEFSIQLDEFDVRLALNDSTLMLKVEA